MAVALSDDDIVPTYREEATDGKIKSLYTFRERLPVAEFLSVLENDIIHQLSRERNVDDIITSQNAKAFANASSINLSLWTSTYHWIKEDREVITMKNNDGKKCILLNHLHFTITMEILIKTLWRSYYIINKTLIGVILIF